jgi:hypothetical protein
MIHEDDTGDMHRGVYCRYTDCCDRIWLYVKVVVNKYVRVIDVHSVNTCIYGEFCCEYDKGVCFEIYWTLGGLRASDVEDDRWIGDRWWDLANKGFYGQRTFVIVVTLLLWHGGSLYGLSVDWCWDILLISAQWCLLFGGHISFA